MQSRKMFCNKKTIFNIDNNLTIDICVSAPGTKLFTSNIVSPKVKTVINKYKQIALENIQYVLRRRKDPRHSSKQWQ